jgi:hypothetical protein
MNATYKPFLIACGAIILAILLLLGAVLGGILPNPLGTESPDRASQKRLGPSPWRGESTLWFKTIERGATDSGILTATITAGGQGLRVQLLSLSRVGELSALRATLLYEPSSLRLVEGLVELESATIRLRARGDQIELSLDSPGAPSRSLDLPLDTVFDLDAFLKLSAMDFGFSPKGYELPCFSLLDFAQSAGQGGETAKEGIMTASLMGTETAGGQLGARPCLKIELRGALAPADALRDESDPRLVRAYKEKDRAFELTKASLGKD